MANSLYLFMYIISKKQLIKHIFKKKHINTK